MKPFTVAASCDFAATHGTLDPADLDATPWVEQPGLDVSKVD
ncbi:hypothetical protein [Catellatospora methionotrophica]|nr:hypothetical protein [Catellatospora methionotrophica]